MQRPLGPICRVSAPDLSRFLPAVNAFKHAVEIDRITQAKDRATLASDLISLGDVLGMHEEEDALRRFDEAFECYSEALSIIKGNSDSKNEAYLLEITDRASKALLNGNRPSEAISLLEEILDTKGRENADDPAVKYALDRIHVCRSFMKGTPENSARKSVRLAMLHLVFGSWSIPLVFGAIFEDSLAYGVPGMFLACALPAFVLKKSRHHR